MPDLGVSQKPVVMPTYPHMMAEDIAVWTKYLQAWLVPIDEVWYDVHVGKPVELGPAASLAELKMAAGITRKRIDVVARVGNVFWVIEVKPRADMRALGQVISYLRLFVLEFAPRREVLGVIVCDQVDGDIVATCEELGVAVITND